MALAKGLLILTVVQVAACSGSCTHYWSSMSARVRRQGRSDGRSVAVDAFGRPEAFPLSATLFGCLSPRGHRFAGPATAVAQPERDG
jgi:hypothetical protein